jgi:cell division protein FtsZ
LSEPGNVVVHITGDALLSLAEVQSVLRQLSRYVEDSSQILLGVAADPSNKGELGVTIMAGSLVSGYADYDDDEAASGEEPEAGELLPSATEGEKPAKSSGKRGKGGKKSGKEQTQEELPLDQAMRGRFKDLDPTMVDGQDLDIPAFIRMRIRLK